MSILYLGGIPVGNTMSFRRQNVLDVFNNRTDRYRSQLWGGHEEARLSVGRPGTDFMFTRPPVGRQSPPVPTACFYDQLTCAVRALGMTS